MEFFENTIPNNAGIAKRAIERMMDHPIELLEEKYMEAGLDRSNMIQVEEALEALTLLSSLNNESPNDEITSVAWTYKEDLEELRDDRITEEDLEDLKIDKSKPIRIVSERLNEKLEEEVRPKGWQEAANSDGYLFNEYNEYEAQK